jgi:hypothetical protein
LPVIRFAKDEQTINYRSSEPIIPTDESGRLLLLRGIIIYSKACADTAKQ